MTKPELWIDKAMDWFSRSKFGKTFAAVTGISLIVASTETACTNAQPTNLPSETAPVPSEVPTLSPTETPTGTATLRPTETETPSPTLDRYGVDTAKLFNNLPTSYAELTANLDKYVQAPDPLPDSSAFMDWWKNRLIPALGDETKLERNVKTFGCISNIGERRCLVVWGQQKPMAGQPELFYFEHQGKVYPALAISLSEQDTAGGQIAPIATITVILREQSAADSSVAGGAYGWEALEKIANGEKIRAIMMSSLPGERFIGDISQQLVAVGLDATDYLDDWLVPAMGFIQTEP